MGIGSKYMDMEEDIGKVDSLIRESLRSRQRILDDAVSELLSAGGKRLRPAVLLLAGSFGRYEESILIPLAASIEIIHMATLVHDDIIDKSEMRRGKPTVRSRWDNETAVFTGDFLFASAFELITRAIAKENINSLSGTIKAICEGEVDQFASRYEGELSVRRYLKRVSRKTAMLFALSCQIGAAESGCSRDTVRYLREFGMNFGMAFQITDDLLDFFGDRGEMGKPQCSDFAEGVYTLPVIYTLRDPGYRDKMVAYIGKRDLDDRDIRTVGLFVEESGGIKRSGNLARRYLERCRGSLSGLPDIPAREVLRELAEGVIGRKY